ncbi:MAG: DUF6314 family protein [Planktomarina sp.]
MILRVQDFEGHWQFTRHIADDLAGQVLLAQGHAHVADGRYDEKAALTLPTGQVLHSTRTYLWTDTPDGIAVAFDDGRPFHIMSHTVLQAHHWCDPDQYDVTYDFAKFPTWTAKWCVKGPRKDYEMITTYSKALQDTPSAM